MNTNKNKNTENRKHQRQTKKEEIFIEILSASENQEQDSLTLECLTQDISKSGIKIQSRYPLIVNSILELLINFQSVKQGFMLTGEVKWLRKIDDEHFLAGFELIESEHSDYLIWYQLFDSRNN